MKKLFGKRGIALLTTMAILVSMVAMLGGLTLTSSAADYTPKRAVTFTVSEGIQQSCMMLEDAFKVAGGKTVNVKGYYKVDSIRESWTSILKRAGLRHRKSYQSRHTYACWSLAAGANPSFIASQMGHTNAQMVFNVYGAWMKDNNHEQIELLNKRLSESVPCMPHKKAG